MKSDLSGSHGNPRRKPFGKETCCGSFCFVLFILFFSFNRQFADINKTLPFSIPSLLAKWNFAGKTISSMLMFYFGVTNHGRLS